MKGDAVLDLLTRHKDQWLVLDRSLTPVDRGPELGALRARWSGRRAIYLRSPSCSWR